MALFRRRRDADQAADPSTSDTSASSAVDGVPAADSGSAGAGAVDASAAGAGGESAVGAAGRGAASTAAVPTATFRAGAVRAGATRAAYQRSNGPFDRSEVDGPDGRLDLGAIWVKPVPGMEIRLEIEELSGAVSSVTALLGESQLQLSAFAAPRSEGIWQEVRDEIAAGVTSSGGVVDEVDGPVGPELVAKIPGQGPDGRRYVTPARFVGVDGPRWFLRGVLTGRSAVEEGAAQALLGVFRATVVVRGDQAMAPRDPLPLTLPEATPPGAVDTTGQASSAGTTDDLRPFERGPEITEVR